MMLPSKTRLSTKRALAQMMFGLIMLGYFIVKKQTLHGRLFIKKPEGLYKIALPKSVLCIIRMCEPLSNVKMWL
jgi:hypothetical protein